MKLIFMVMLLSVLWSTVVVATPPSDSPSPSNCKWKQGLRRFFCLQPTETYIKDHSIPNVDQEFQMWLPAFLERSKAITWVNPRGPATKRIVKEMKVLLEHQSETHRKDLDYLVYVDENNFHHWMVKFINFRRKNKGTRLAKDMKRHGVDEIMTEIIFPSTYPTDPPFIRIISPRFEVPTNGVRGRIMAEGTFCSPFFIRGHAYDYWKETHSMSMVLQQVRNIFFEPNDNGQLARLVSDHSKQYGFRSAIQAYLNTVNARHKEWKLPDGFMNEIQRIPN